MPRAKLSNISIETLKKEIAKRAAKVDKLKAQRDKRDKQIRQIEGAIGPAKKPAAKKRTRKPGPKPGGKPKATRGGAKPLGQYVKQVLTASKAGLSVKAIEKAVIAAGYPTSAKSIYNPILKVMRKGGFKKVARGVYAVKGAGKAAVKPAKKAAGPAKPKAARKRKKYDQTAEQFILGLVKGKGAISSAINKAWQLAGRTGRADNTLNKMLKAGKLKREKIQGAKGSTYTVA